MHHHCHIKAQKGVVLIMSMVILFAMTLIGISSMNTTSLEERIASNNRDRQIAFQAAEAALRQGERDTKNPTDTAFTTANYLTDCPDGLCDCGDISVGCVTYWVDDVPTKSDVAWNISSTHRTYSTLLNGVTTPAKYILEFMGYVCPTSASCTPAAGDPKIFRVTALATGRTNSSKVMLQSTIQVSEY